MGSLATSNPSVSVGSIVTAVQAKKLGRFRSSSVDSDAEDNKRTANTASEWLVANLDQDAATTDDGKKASDTKSSRNAALFQRIEERKAKRASALALRNSRRKRAAAKANQTWGRWLVHEFIIRRCDNHCWSFWILTLTNASSFLVTINCGSKKKKKNSPENIILFSFFLPCLKILIKKLTF